MRAKLLNLLWVTLACLPGLVGTTPHAAAEAATHRDFLWHIQTPANTVFLLGSVHALRAEDYPLPPPYMDAYGEADAVVVETRTIGQAAADEVMRAIGQSRGGAPLDERLSPAELDRARELAEGLGYELAPLGRLDPWLAGMVVMQNELRKAGFEPQHGVDAFFQRRADADGKPVLTLESPSEQINMLRELPDALQSDFLLQALEEAANLGEELAELVEAWQAGDRETVRRLVRDELEPYPRLRERLVLERNRSWLPRIESFVGDDRDYLVIVGAAHLLGEQGVLALLREEGYRVSP